MHNILSNATNFLLLILVVMSIYAMFSYIKSNIKQNSKLSTEVLELLENSARYAVHYAEQLYKNDELIDRFQFALDFMYNFVKRLDLDYSDLEKLIKGMIETHVFNLPTTHKTE
ncbi:MAG: phage holin, LLH family [Syntrophothermus sp.]